jgi:anti-sigma B factor antagonist
MRLANIKIDVQDRIVVARLDGEFDLSNAAEVREAISGRVTNEATGLVLDLSGTRFIDSAGIHGLFDLRTRLKNRGQEMRLVVPSGAAIAEALRIVGIPPSIGVSETTEAALESIGGEVTKTGNS